MFNICLSIRWSYIAISALLILLLALRVNADLLYTYDETVVGFLRHDSWCLMNAQWIPGFAGTRPTTHYNTASEEGAIPLTVRSRVPRWSNVTEYETWVFQDNRNGASPWFGVTNAFSMGCGGLTVAVGEAGIRMLRIRFPDDHKKEIEDGSYGQLKVIANEGYTWQGMKKGTGVLMQGRKCSIVGADVASLSFRMHLKNVGSNPIVFDTKEEFMFLISSTGDLVTPLLAPGPEKRKIDPSDEEVIKLQTPMEGYDQLNNNEFLYFMHLGRGWKWKVPVLDKDQIAWMRSPPDCAQGK